MHSKAVAIIPARGGSKGVPGKNIKHLGGYPLIAYSILAAKLARGIERVIVSTDSPEIAAIAKRYGAEVPFMRPAEISGDTATDLELFSHVIEWLYKNSALPSLLVHLRPTTPFRQAQEITRALELIESHPQVTSLRSVHEMSEPPHKMFQLGENGCLQGFFPDDGRPEYYNLPRQLLPKAYYPNGYVDIIKPDYLRTTRKLHGPDILGFVTSVVKEVDRQDDFEYLEYQLTRNKIPLHEYLKNNFTGEE
ncbi:MAG: acylneuraminate cytidylyltransferase family protein [Candidatus Omnitrophota bacterium]